MREIAFIKQNKGKWMEIEKVIAGTLRKDPDDLSSLYIDLINDLSFAQSYYPKSKTTVYLNFLAVQIYQKIYKTKRLGKGRIKSFFQKEVPLLMYENRRVLLFTFLIFLMFVGVGVISSVEDSGFTKLILGDSYVHQTLENIKKGDATGIYGSGSNWGAAIAIIYNNLKVAGSMVVFGVFAGVGTLLALMQNAIMLGTFQELFAQHGVLEQSVRGIWIHGAFEISAIIVDASAGFILGAAILFPKTFSRIESFKIGFRKALNIFLSSVPFIVAAGILEGFITRYAQKMPVAVDFTIILGTFAVIFYYYVVYPVHVHKKSQQDAVL